MLARMYVGGRGALCFQVSTRFYEALFPPALPRFALLPNRVESYPQPAHHVVFLLRYNLPHMHLKTQEFGLQMPQMIHEFLSVAVDFLQTPLMFLFQGDIHLSLHLPFRLQELDMGGGGVVDLGRGSGRRVDRQASHAPDTQAIATDKRGGRRDRSVSDSRTRHREECGTLRLLRQVFSKYDSLRLSMDSSPTPISLVASPCLSRTPLFRIKGVFS